MKKYIERLFLLVVALVAFTACSDDDGTNPGNDKSPKATIYTYNASKPYNSDNDVILRIATNNKTQEVYYLAEKTTDKQARQLSDADYAAYIVANGTKVEDLADNAEKDVIITDMFGDYTISVVAVNGNERVLSTTTFTGLEWEKVTDGTYYFFRSAITGMEENATTLEVCTTDPTLFHLKDVFGEGSHLKFQLIDQTGTDEDGKYTFFRVPVQETPFTYGDYGTVSIRDIGYWQNNDAFVTDYGYESGMYEDYSAFFYVQYFISAGNLGYGYEYFIPD